MQLCARACVNAGQGSPGNARGSPFAGFSRRQILGKGTGCALVWPRPSAGSSRIACSNGHMSRPQRPDGSGHYPLGQRKLPWSILHVGEANGNFLVRQAAPTAPSRWRGASWNSPIWPNGHFGSSPSGQRLYSGWPLRGSSGQPGRGLWAGGPPFTRI